MVPALAEGVIEQLLVVAGEAVEAGQPVAMLVDVDARLALGVAEADLQWKEAELAAARAALVAARSEVDRPVHLEVSLADAQSLLVKVQTDW
jgi:HlyD family secretion protein